MRSLRIISSLFVLGSFGGLLYLAQLTLRNAIPNAEAQLSICGAGKNCTVSEVNTTRTTGTNDFRGTIRLYTGGGDATGIFLPTDTAICWSNSSSPISGACNSGQIIGNNGSNMKLNTTGGTFTFTKGGDSTTSIITAGTFNGSVVGSNLTKNSFVGTYGAFVNTRAKSRMIQCGLSTGSAFYDIAAGANCGTQTGVSSSRVAEQVAGAGLGYVLAGDFQSVTTGVTSYVTTSTAGFLWQTSPEFEGWFRLDSTSNVAVKIQLSSTSAATNCTTNLNSTAMDETTWKLDTSASANWKYCTGSGGGAGTVTCADSALASDTAWHYFKISLVPSSDLTTLGSVVFTLDDQTFTGLLTLPDLGTTTVLLPTICMDQTDDVGTANLYSSGWVVRSY